jgi:hypothetical protein
MTRHEKQERRRITQNTRTEFLNTFETELTHTREVLVTEIDLLKEEELVLSNEIIAWREEVERRRLEIQIREEEVQRRVKVLRQTVVEMAD